MLMKQLEEIRRENKSLKRDNVLQTKQLDKFQDQEGELPQLMDSHNKEVRALKEQIRWVLRVASVGRYMCTHSLRHDT